MAHQMSAANAGFKYNHSREQSAEFLRMALAMMSKQPAALHPVSYALWYEYVSGINPRLREAIDEIVESGRKLDENTACSLYVQHVADADETKVRHIATAFYDIMIHLASSTRTTGEQVGRYGDALTQWEDRLKLPALQEVLTATNLRELLSHTNDIKRSVKGLTERLETTQREIETMREELVNARTEAMVDTLTGLYNRKGFEHHLSRHLDSDLRLREPLCLMMLDIDHFKRINDSYGHLVGDKVIAVVGQLIKDNIKGQDIGVRYGGEEYLLALPDTDISGAVQLADKLRRLVAGSHIKRVTSGEMLEGVTISVGIAYGAIGDTLDVVIGYADRALYTSKAEGRNRVTVAALKNASGGGA